MLLRLTGYFFGFGALVAILIAGGIFLFITDLAKDLPDYEVLNAYEPPVTTRMYASDGSLMAEYAKERRLYLPIQAVPEVIKNAFISAEDKNFYSHIGVDLRALGGAILGNIQNYGTGRRSKGASTITQQVAKNFLLTNERSYERKIKEAILALRIEQAYSKDRILELYLNEIFMGLGAYGIAGASLTYFNKSVHQIELHEAAYMAALPKAPNNYHPFRKTDDALVRRNWVLGRMEANGFATAAEVEKAKTMPLSVNPRRRSLYLLAGEYFSEEVRREIVDRYGEDALYEGGLSIRTTLDPKLQGMARKSLQDGLVKFDIARGFRGVVANVELGEDWGKSFGEIKSLSDVPEWKLAVVLSTGDDFITIGIRPEKQASGSLSDDRITGTIVLGDMKWALKIRDSVKKSHKVKLASDVLAVGDVVFVELLNEAEKPDAYKLRQLPEISGAIVVMDPHTGRVLAMAGGYSFAASQFNRATQANRQPGSSFKPFVYAAALDNGYTPSSVVLDAPIKVKQGGRLGIWSPKNYGGKFAGPSTLRLGIEKSRNLMTVRLAKDMGMPLVAEYAKRFGVYDQLQPVLSMSLGAGETTVIRMVSGYSVLANGGKKITPSMIDRIQDRYGKTIFTHEQRICDTCNVTSWSGQEEPELSDSREQVLDPMTAYQVTSMMEGVVKRGTAPVVRKVNVPIAGKTGTTNSEKDAWFVGYSTDLAVGVYVGYDTPRSMGRGFTGGHLAAPIFTDFMIKALEGKKPVEFRVPAGVRLLPINGKTGLLAKAGDEGVIMEAFKPGTSPPDVFSVIGFAGDMIRGQISITPDANREVIERGLY